MHRRLEKSLRAKILLISLILIILLPVIIPLFSSYVPGTADGMAHKFRLASFVKSLKDGNLRPRWLSDQALGYGSPIFLFNYLLPYYIVAAVHKFGFSINTSTQIYEAMTLFGSFLAMYLLVKKLWGVKAGLVAATVYTWAPYHLLTVYLYEGWGEMGAFVFPPLICYSIVHLVNPSSSISHQYKILKIKYKKFMVNIRIFYFIFCILSWFLFILTHNVSVLLFTPVILGFGAMYSRINLKNFLTVISPFILAVFLSAFFWLPALILKNQTRYPELIVQEMGMRGSYFKSLETLISVAISTIRNGHVWYYDFTIGLPILLAPILVIGYWGYTIIQTGKKNLRKFPMANILHNLSLIKLDNWLIGLLVFIGLFSLYLTNFSSNWIWELINPLKYIVYPFRFLFLATFAGSILAGWLARNNIALFILFILLAIVSGVPYTRSTIDVFSFDDKYFQNAQTILHAPGTKKNMAIIEFLPRWASLDFLTGIAEPEFFTTKKLPEKFILHDGIGTVENQIIGVEKLEATVNLKKDSQLTVNTFYFPNWKAKLDGRQIQVGKDNQGRISLEIPSGEHIINLIFAKTNIENIANIISISGILLFLLYLGLGVKRSLAFKPN